MAGAVIDLRVRGKGCSGDPVFRLNSILSRGDDELILLTDPIKLPLEVVTLMAKRKGYVLVSHEESGGSLKVVLKRKT